MEKELTHEQRIQLLLNAPGETISPSVAAKVLGGVAYWYNLSAQNGRMTLPHIWRGRNLRIFKQPILDILQGSKGGAGMAQAGRAALGDVRM